MVKCNPAQYCSQDQDLVNAGGTRSGCCHARACRLGSPSWRPNIIWPTRPGTAVQPAGPWPRPPTRAAGLSVPPQGGDRGRYWKEFAAPWCHYQPEWDVRGNPPEIIERVEFNFLFKRLGFSLDMTQTIVHDYGYDTPKSSSSGL